jgi:hypothetical protein
MSEIVSYLQVLITVSSSPKLLEAQLLSIFKFFPASTKVLVVDDSRRRPHASNNNTRGSAKRFRQVAKANGAQYVRMPQVQHFMRHRLYSSPNPSPRFTSFPSYRHADALQFGLAILGPNIQQLMILDSDIVPIAEFVPETYFAEAAVWHFPLVWPGKNGEVVYPSPVLFFADFTNANSTKAMNWDYGVVDGFQSDTGGSMIPWLEANAHQSKVITGLTRGTWKWDRETSSIPLCFEKFLDFDAQYNNGLQFCEVFLDAFLHFAAGSNYNSEKQNSFEKRMALFIDSIRILVNK